MTNDEIKKALDCCSRPDVSINNCKDCPYSNKGIFTCTYGQMCKDALKLIEEQEQEISILRRELQDFLDDILRRCKVEN